ncbi:IS66 family insertion sequence element accessory protein TnpB (plasmid) [Bradyrhizobium septentrionale]|uniref:IS66 family insertion sequence element accessory protein TnpB n=1 Tax=Bradyrhizobium septentrionale TaxID=1404411 RepID=A0A973WAX5_9BRAD|nr:IS66 family insertion sequence element accessory protein TnpB [Bradyrhizobium septentrionale]UGY30273.1 IS66 family insertion sequence element accessory protein TnpB [Bradyrhizobium septentrionale]
MIAAGADLKIYIATRPIDFRCGHDGLAAKVQEMLRLDPFSGAAFVFRSRRAQLVSWYVPLSDSRQTDHPIVLIINVVFRSTFDHALHRYAYCFRTQRVDGDRTHTTKLTITHIF